MDVGSAAHNPQPRGEWSWPPEAAWRPDEGSRFLTDQWAPASTVRRPWVRLGRWTLLYRRGAQRPITDTAA